VRLNLNNSFSQPSYTLPSRAGSESLGHNFSFLWGNNKKNIIFLLLLVFLVSKVTWAQIPDSSRVALFYEGEDSVLVTLFKNQLENKISQNFKLETCIPLNKDSLRQFLYSYPENSNQLRQYLPCKAEYVVFFSKLDYRIFGYKNQSVARNHVVGVHYRLFAIQAGKLLKFTVLEGKQIARTERCPQCLVGAIENLAYQVRQEMRMGWQKTRPVLSMTSSIAAHHLLPLNKAFSKNLGPGLHLNIGADLGWQTGGLGAELGYIRNQGTKEYPAYDTLLIGYTGHLYVYRGFRLGLGLYQLLPSFSLGYRLSTYRVSLPNSENNYQYVILPHSSMTLGFLTEISMPDQGYRIVPRILWNWQIQKGYYDSYDYRKIQTQSGNPSLSNASSPELNFSSLEWGVLFKFYF